MNTSLNGGIMPFAVLSNPFPNGIVTPPQRNGDPNVALYGQGITYADYRQSSGLRPANGMVIFKSNSVRFPHRRRLRRLQRNALSLRTQSLNYLPAQLLSLGNFLTQTVANPFQEKVPATSPFNTAAISNGQLLRRFPQFGSVTLASQGSGDSIYHSFQLKAEKRFSKAVR